MLLEIYPGKLTPLRNESMRSRLKDVCETRILCLNTVNLWSFLKWLRTGFFLLKTDIAFFVYILWVDGDKVLQDIWVKLSRTGRRPFSTRQHLGCCMMEEAKVKAWLRVVWGIQVFLSSLYILVLFKHGILINYEL